MTKLDRFLAGIESVRKLIVGASFYNSSGDSCSFQLSGKLSPEKQEALTKLGWDVSSSTMSFTDYGDWSKEE